MPTTEYTGPPIFSSKYSTNIKKTLVHLKVELIITHLFIEIEEIKIKGNALRECLNHDDNVYAYNQTRPILVKVRFCQKVLMFLS